MHRFRVYFSRVIREDLLCQEIEAETLQDAIDQTLDYRAEELSTLSDNAQVTEANVTRVEYEGILVDLGSVTTSKAARFQREVRDDSQALDTMVRDDPRDLEWQRRASGGKRNRTEAVVLSTRKSIPFESWNQAGPGELDTQS